MLQVPYDDDTPDGIVAAEALSMAVTELVARSGELKGELVEFAQHPRFGRQLTARLRAAGSNGLLDEGVAVRTVDHFALQHRLHDGTTVVERFVAQRRPPLTADERAMLLGWRDVVEGLFEVHRADDGTVVLHNLIDDLRYPVRSNMGSEALAVLEQGMFTYGRIVPVHPATGHWLVSGYLSPYPQSSGSDVARAALRMATADPGLLRRNQDLSRRAWQMQAEDRAAFINLFGSDLVILPPATAQEQLTEHHRRRLEEATASAETDGRPTTDSAPEAEEMGRLPEDYMQADSVGLIYDETEGLNYYLDFGRLDALFANPSLASDHTYITQLRNYLSDDTVSPLPLRRLVQRHPDSADAVFRALLRKPGFSWPHDGEDLLRSRKKSFFHQETAPSISVVGERLAELLRTPN
ncbi:MULTISPECIES: hypothetical protein [unclassified Streptomyces]|uniref:hypothetical protein n=1 Tax=unclassified Streptomyces TaxID=2593676 RepID=UPI00226F94C0|nr:MULTISPECIES: hypothetical protein [unclassified Streptomyces]MCY0923555.1 hypothetical protein [Streptomyces sp. H27-G5]MCY0962675.1 hypothetical protein [Streptomyces sp. H27-H5]